MELSPQLLTIITAILAGGIPSGLIYLWNVVSKRAPAQNMLDESTAAKNFQDALIKMQEAEKERDARVERAEREREKRIRELEAKLNSAYLHVIFSVRIGEKPKVEDYKWIPIEEARL